MKLSSEITSAWHSQAEITSRGKREITSQRFYAVKLPQTRSRV